MKVLVRKQGCVGHARCAAAAPEVYKLDESGYIDFTEKEIPQDLEAQARRGARACPERIITIIGDGESA
ncbi:MAG: ferredoxin [Nevskia sp.]|nr:ferredoxin [Nevskia sp.]